VIPSARLLVVIPTFRAAATIGSVVTAARRVVPNVMVIDDGSDDGSGDVARGAGATVIRFELNQGKGRALQVGFAQATRSGASAVVTIDADGQHDPAEIPRLVTCWEATGASLVIGARSRGREGMTASRRFGNRFADRAISFFAGAPVPDTQSGFRLYDAALLASVRLRGSGYELESEVIVKAVRSGLRVASIEVRSPRVDGTTTSHFRPWADTARICWAVVASRLRS